MNNKSNAVALISMAQSGSLGEEVWPMLCLLHASFYGIPADPIDASPDSLNKLERLGIGRREVNILNGKPVFILSGFGKTVIRVMPRLKP